MATKVKPATALKGGTPPVWTMDPVYCAIIESIPAQSEKGVLITMAYLNKIKKCSQAEIDFIDDVRIIVTPPEIPIGRKTS